MRTAMIDALILDYGGVVMHEDPAHYHAIDTSLGFEPGRLWELVHTIPEHRQSRTGEIGASEFEHAVRTKLAALVGAEPARIAVDALLSHYRALEPMRPVMRELLASLRGRLKLVLLSNATRGSTREFESRGLGAYFDAIVCSGDVGVAKPDAAAFELAAARAGVPLSRCAFVDDVQANADAARALGMQALHYHLERHHELLDALRAWGVGV